MPKHVFVVAIATMLAASLAQAANLAKNGSFEKPVVPDGGFQQFSTGESIKQWMVVGAAGSVAVISGSLSEQGFTFPAKKGAQWLDLTGAGSNSATGVQQTIKTNSGATYSLTFYVGNVVQPGGPLGVSSTVNILVDDVPLGSFTNSRNGDNVLTWQKFSTDFVARKTHTTIALINGDTPTDHVNGLDGVSVTLATAP